MKTSIHVYMKTHATHGKLDQTKGVSTMTFIDLRIHFDVTKEDDHTDYSVAKITRLETTVPKDDILGVQEGLAQSDFGSIDFNNGIIDALAGNEVKFDRN